MMLVSVLTNVREGMSGKVYFRDRHGGLNGLRPGSRLPALGSRLSVIGNRLSGSARTIAR
jgi:hypothetical protein